MSKEATKVKPTQAMLDYRKELAEEQIKANDKMQDYNQQTNLKRSSVNKRITKLKRDRDLAAEAAIGYGLAIKAIEENLRSLDEELTEVNAEIDKERPPYRNTFGLFKAKFGYDEHEIDWGAK